MTHSLFSILVINIAVFLSGSSRLITQQTATPKPPVLAVQVMDGRQGILAPIFWPPSEGGMEMGPTKPLADWKKTGDGPPLTGIRIQATMEGDAARIRVTAVLDDSYPVDAPGPKYGRVEKVIGSYLAREGETIKVNEIADYGFEPLVLKIVKAVPREEETQIDFNLPQLVNNLKAVEVVSFIPEPALTNSYHLTVRNVSNKNIVAFNVYQPMERGRGGVTSVSVDPSRPVMMPGATHRLILHVTRGRYKTENGYIPEPLINKFIIGTVVFDDETYQGESKEAVSIIATRTGNRIQLARAATLLQKTLESPQQDPAAMLERLRSEVSGLRIDVDAQVIVDLAARFPELPNTYKGTPLGESVMRGLKEGRESVLRRIKDIEDAAKRDSISDGAVWQRLNSLKEQLENESRPVRQATRAGA